MRGRLQVDLTALVANYRWYCEQCEEAAACVASVVKADAYGLGVTAVSESLFAAGCREFFVATCEEGLTLRQVLPDARIYVFEGSSSDTAKRLAGARLIPVVNHPGQLITWRPHRALPIAVHIDTGMERLGFADDVTPADLAEFEVELLVTHLACSDTPDHPLNAAQIHRFDAVAARFPGIRTSIGNSAGLIMGAPFRGDLCRTGIGLYGANPFSDRTNPMQCVASLSAQVLQVRDVAAGVPLGYGATFVASENLKVAVVGIGYADGLPRLLSNRGEVSIGERRCAIVGRISMDLTLVDVSDLQVATGDWVQFFGDQVSVDEVGGWADSIAYEVLTGVGPRVERIYLSG
ncbi:MAG: alanine racemase [Pseudomonadales bacterium]|jgi:alanine racemase